MHGAFRELRPPAKWRSCRCFSSTSSRRRTKWTRGCNSTGWPRCRARPQKRQGALREVIVAEQIQRMLRSNHALLEFEDVRLQLAAEQDTAKTGALLDRLETILRQEIARTELSLLAATRDSRLGFQFEQDYVYTPYSLREKLGSLHETLEQQLPAYRKARKLPQR